MSEPVKLSDFERQALYNQYEILSLLDSNKKDHYDNLKEIVSSGYTAEYYRVIGSWDELPLAECRYVQEVLEMHSALLGSYENLADKAGINLNDIEFKGFDGNNEAELRSYAAFLGRMGRWLECKPGKNSHFVGTVDRYPEMLKKWKALKEQHGSEIEQSLTAEEIKSIIS